VGFVYCGVIIVCVALIVFKGLRVEVRIIDGSAVGKLSPPRKPMDKKEMDRFLGLNMPEEERAKYRVSE
jgi:hypothetical protein